MKGNGRPIRLMEKECFLMEKVISMMESGNLIRLMGMEYIYIIMDQNIQDTGRTIFRVEKARKYGMIILFMKGVIWMARNVEKGNSCGMISHVMKENGEIIKSTDMYILFIIISICIFIYEGVY